MDFSIAVLVYQRVTRIIPHRKPGADIATFKVHLSRQTCGEGDLCDMRPLDLGETFPMKQQASPQVGVQTEGHLAREPQHQTWEALETPCRSASGPQIGGFPSTPKSIFLSQTPHEQCQKTTINNWCVIFLQRTDWTSNS